MKRHAIELLIEKADHAINQEDFDTLVSIYADDAVLVIKPGMNAVGKDQIRKAFEAIAAHFEHSLDVKQAGMKILVTGDTALVLSKTLVSANNTPAAERKATYVFKKIKTAIGYVQLIILMVMTYLKKKPKQRINADNLTLRRSSSCIKVPAFAGR